MITAGSFINRSLHATLTIARSSVGMLVPAFAVFVLTFATTDALERMYDRHHAFDQANTLFDADPILFADVGPSWRNDTYSHFRHPLIDLVLSLPLRASSAEICAVESCEASNLRRNLSLLVTPLVEAVKGTLLYVTFVWLGITPLRAGILCAVNLVSLSTLTVGSVPETFPMSSLAITVLIALLVASFRHRPPPKTYWIAAGTFATGVTLTNVFPLAICFLLSRRRGQDARIGPAVRETGVVTGTVVAMTASLAVLSALMAHAHLSDLLPRASRNDFGESRPGLPVPEQLTVALSSTFAGVIEPDIIHNDYAANPFDRELSPVIPVRWTYSTRRVNTIGSWTWVFLSVVLLVIGAYRAYHGSIAWNSLMVACVTLMVFNIALHFFFYLNDMFLFALHWQVPMLFLLAGWMRKDRRPDYGPVALSVLVLICAVTAYHILSRFVAVASTFG
jgi:hypothetical protein